MKDGDNFFKIHLEVAQSGGKLMTDYRDVSLNVSTYKSFGPQGGDIPKILPINVIIGRNNTGKSALIDVFEFLCDRKEIPARHHHRASPPQIRLSVPGAERPLRGVFNENTSGGEIGGNHWYQVGQHLVGKRFTATVDRGGMNYFDLEASASRFSQMPALRTYLQNAVQNHSYPFDGLMFKRIDAERDVRPEQYLANPDIKATAKG